jgi:hypothetical protein
VKTTLRSINSTLLTVSENKKFLSKGLEEMANMLEHKMERRRKCLLLIRCC